MHRPQCHNNLRLHAKELEQVVAELNRNRVAAPDTWRRRSRRWLCQFQRIVLTLDDGQSGPRHHAIVPRDISIDGMCAIHGSYVHTGTICAVTMRTVNWSAQSISGSVVRCRHLRGHLHELGIRFDRRLSPRDYIVTFGDDYLFQSENVKPAELKGRVLVVMANAADQRLVTYHYRNTKLELVFADNYQAAVARFKERFDFALVDNDLPGGDGVGLMRKVRQLGCALPTVLVSIERDRDLRYAAIAAGAREMIFKPIDENVLLSAAADFVLLDRDGVQPSAADAAAGPRLANEIVGSYCSELRQASDQLRAGLAAGDTHALSAPCGKIALEAPGFGFAAVGAQAASTIALIQGGASIDIVRPEVETLIIMIGRANAPARARAA